MMASLDGDRQWTSLNRVLFVAAGSWEAKRMDREKVMMAEIVDFHSVYIYA